jgi:hypothetical protein
MLYAVDYAVMNNGHHTEVVTANDPDDAYDRARSIIARRFVSASIQGTARVATEADERRAESLGKRDRGSDLLP